MAALKPSRLLTRATPSDDQLGRVQLQARLKWPLSGIKLECVLKASEETSVFRGVRGTDPVVVKKFWNHRTRREFVSGTKKALKRFEGLGRHTDFSTNKYFASSGHLGLLVLSFEPGTPVDQLLRQQVANRPQILRSCYAWQNWANQGASQLSPLPQKRIAAEIDALLETSKNHPDAAILRELGDALMCMMARLSTRSGVRVPGHPDFAPRNLILRADGGVAAIDIHRSGTFFRSRQAAIFLVSKDFQSRRMDGPLLYGLDRDELLQFLADGKVPDDEVETFLVFFIGLTFLRMYANKMRRVRQMKLRHLRIRAYLDDLRQGRSMCQ